MSDTIASLKAVIGADISGLRQGLGQAESVLGRTADKMMGVGMAMTAMSTPIALAFGAGLNVASQFSDVMTDLQARAHLSGDELERVKEAAIDMGAKTMFSATDAANAMLRMQFAGLSVNEALQATPAVLDMAAASSMSLSDAAYTATIIMKEFSLTASEITGVTDTLSRADQASATNVSELSQAFANVGPIAKEFGLNVQDTAAVLAIFADRGISGAEAGTQLKSMLTHMASDTGQQAMEKLGVSLYYTTEQIKAMTKEQKAAAAAGDSFFAILPKEGDVRPIADVIQDMKNTMAGMSDKERVSALQNIAGAYGKLGLASLLSSDGVAAMQKKMGEQASVSDVAKAKMETFSGSLESLKGSFEALGIQTITPFMTKTLTPLVKGLTDAVNSVIDWAKRNPELAGTIITLTAAAIALGPAIAGVGVALKAVSAAGTLLQPIQSLQGLQWVTNSKNVGGLVTRLFGLVGALDLLYQMVTSKDFTQVWAENLKNLGIIIDEINKKLGLTGTINDTAKPPDIMQAGTQGVQQAQNRQNSEWGRFQGQILSGDLMDKIKQKKLTADDMVDPVALEIVTARLLALYGPQGTLDLMLGSANQMVNSKALQVVQTWNNASQGLAGFFASPLIEGVKTVGKLLMGVGAVGGGSFAGLAGIGAALIGVAQGLATPRDTGGHGFPGQRYSIGNMAEIFWPASAGEFYPLNQGGGGGGTTNITLNAYGVNDPVRLTDMVQDEMKRRRLN